MAKPDLGKILAELDEENIARVVHIRHAERRKQYPMRILIVGGYQEFCKEIGKYYVHQIGATAPGGIVAMADWMAEGYAEQIVESAFSRVGGSAGACQMAQKGIHGGMWPVINAIYESIVRIEEERYIDKVIRTNIDPMVWTDKVECMRQFIHRFGYPMSNGKRVKTPEELAKDCEIIIKFLTEKLGSIRSKVRL